LVQTGLGANTARCVANLIVDHDPDLVCLLGFAGGLDPSLLTGDTVEGGVVWSAETGEVVVPVPLGVAARMKELLSTKIIVESPEAKAELFRRHGCAAVEMEAFEVGKVCEAHGKSWMTARAISDASNEAFPKELGGIVKPSGDLSLLSLGVAVVKTPSLVVPLYRLYGNSRKAKQGLQYIVLKLVKVLT